MVVRVARIAIGMVNRKRSGRISPYPGLRNAISVAQGETAFWC